MMNFGDGSIQHTLPEADGSIDADDRAHLLGLYGVAVVVISTQAPFLQIGDVFVPGAERGANTVMVPGIESGHVFTPNART